MNREVCEHLGQKILDAEGYSGWRIVCIHSGGGVCMIKRREIWLDESHMNSIPWILHEIAHIKYPDHSSVWADHFTALLDKYVKNHPEQFLDMVPTDDDIERITNSVGMNPGGWDFVNPKEIISAAWRILIERLIGNNG